MKVYTFSMLAASILLAVPVLAEGENVDPTEGTVNQLNNEPYGYGSYNQAPAQGAYHGYSGYSGEYPGYPAAGSNSGFGFGFGNNGGSFQAGYNGGQGNPYGGGFNFGFGHEPNYGQNGYQAAPPPVPAAAPNGQNDAWGYNYNPYQPHYPAYPAYAPQPYPVQPKPVSAPAVPVAPAVPAVPLATTAAPYVPQQTIPRGPFPPIETPYAVSSAIPHPAVNTQLHATASSLAGQVSPTHV